MVQVTKSTKTISSKDIQREWKLVDLEGKILGRIANEIATHLQGKNKVMYSPNIDVGDNVVVINAKKVLLTQNKAAKKTYTSFSGYPGGLRTISYEKMMEKNPGEIIRHAVSGMLPKNKLRDQRLARLHVFSDEKHSFSSKFTK
jgi:large subunit ribosomal protein L13